MSSNVRVLLVIIVACAHGASAICRSCESTCSPKASDKENGACVFTSEVTASGCTEWLPNNNIPNITRGDTIFNPVTSHSSIDNRKANGFSIAFTNINFDYLQLEYKESLNSEASCHVFNMSSQSVGGLSHTCVCSQLVVGTAMELTYQAYNSKTTAIDEGHYIFRVPNPNRIEPENTTLEDWEFFLYVDLSDISRIAVHWPAPPAHFRVQYYILKLIHEKNEISKRVIESHAVPVSKERKAELFVLETGSYMGRFYISVEVLHEKCAGHSCYVSKSPVFIIDSRLKSPLIIAAIGILILFPGFLYIFHSWRRFGSLPPHKAPVVLLIYKRTMDTHFRVIVALVMYLRKYCNVRALIEDFDILSANTQDTSSWYQDAFSRVDAVMVVSSPHHMESNSEKAYYNVNPAALQILDEKSNDETCSLKLFSVILPYCTERDIPREAENLPKFYFPAELTPMLWFIRFGQINSWYSELEYYLFQSQINGGACDFSRNGKFLRNALVEASDESRRLWAMRTDAERV